MSYNMQGLGALLEMYGEGICNMQDSHNQVTRSCLGRTINGCRDMICQIQYGGQDPEKEEAQVKEIQSLEKQLDDYNTKPSSYKQKKEIESLKSKIKQLRKEIGGNTEEIGNKLLSRSLLGVTKLQRQLSKGIDQFGKKKPRTPAVPPSVFNRRNALTPPPLKDSLPQDTPKATDCNTILKQQGILDSDPKTTRRNFKKWALKNHPDKGGNNSVFQSVSNCSDKSDSDDSDSDSGLELLKSPLKSIGWTSSPASSTASTASTKSTTSGLKSIGWTSTPTASTASTESTTSGLKSIGWTKDSDTSKTDTRASSNVDLTKLEDSYDQFKNVILNRKKANEKRRKAFEPVQHPSPWKL